MGLFNDFIYKCHCITGSKRLMEYEIISYNNGEEFMNLCVHNSDFLGGENYKLKTNR